MKNQSDLESVLQPWLDEIKPVPDRDPQRVRRARAEFLNRAVSVSELRSHKGWNFKFRKEQFAMNVLLSILVIAGMLFGGGATVRAAQNDLPNEPLYGLKTFSEDFSLEFQNTSEDKVNRLMQLTQVRVQEMAQLTDKGAPIPDQVQLRLEQHIQQALQICSTMDDTALDQTLLQVRDQLRERDRDMEQLQIHAMQNEQPILERTREMLQQRLQLVDDGLLNHEMFRNAVRNGQEENLTPPVMNGNGEQNGQPTSIPGGPNPEPGGPNTDAGGPNLTPGGPNPGSGTPNTDPGGPNPDSGGNQNSSGSEGNTNTNDSGGSGNGSGGNGP